MQKLETVEQIADRIMTKEVLCCISQHITRLLQGPDADSYIDELSPALSVDDWETPVLEALWALDDGQEVQTLLDAATVAGLDNADLPPTVGDWHQDRDSAIQAIREVACCLEHPHEIADLWREIGEAVGIDDPHTHEALEFWIVSDWLAEKLEAHGEPVAELDGLPIWGRTCSGQMISADGPILEIARGIAHLRIGYGGNPNTKD